MNSLVLCTMITLLSMIFVINIYTTYLFLNLAIERDPYRVISDDNIHKFGICINDYYSHYYDMYQKMNMIENEVCEPVIERDEM